LAFTGLYIKKRRSPVVIAAPHDGDDMDSCCDGNSGLIAGRLADHLGATLVLARNLRRLVDVNKDPETSSDPRLAEWRRRYQRCVFQSSPLLLMEIHGHVSGNFDLEISTGYAGIDSLYRRRLACYHQAVLSALDRTWQPGGPLAAIKKPTLGVFPLDCRVRLRATKTYTFQLVRALRLLGYPCYGLHVEVHRYLRLPPPGGPEVHEALAAILAAGISCFLPGQ
jgi:hypothetical protein